jgi:hypothetical protein
LIERALSSIEEGYLTACRRAEHRSPEGTTAPVLGYVGRDKIERMLKKLPDAKLRDLPASSLAAVIGAKLAEATKPHQIKDDFLHAFFRPRVNRVNVVTLDDNRRQLEALRTDYSHQEVPDLSRKRTREIERLLTDAT